MKTLKYLAFIIILFFAIKANSQTDKSKSEVFKLLKTTTIDTIKVDCYNELCWPIYSYTDIDSAIYFGTKAIELAEKINDIKRLSLAHRRIGIAYINSNNIEKNIFHQQQSYNLAKRINFKKGMANALNNLGVAYNNASNFNIAIDYYLRSLKIRESLFDTANLGSSYFNVGLVYESLNNYSKAKEYYLKALKYGELANNKDAISYAYNGLAAVYCENKLFDSALVFYTKALDINLKIKNTLFIIQSYNHLGFFYEKTKDYKKSNMYSFEAIKLLKEFDAPRDLANTYLRLTNNYFNLNKLDSANYFGKKAYETSYKENDMSNLEPTTYMLANIYAKKNNYTEAYKYLNMNKIYSDSLKSQDKLKDIMQKQMQFEYEKKSLADSIQFAEKEKVTNALLEADQAKLDQAKTVRYTLIFGILLVLGFLGFVFTRFKISKQQNKIISKQHHEVTEQKQIIEEKQKEIIDSINYAKRLQGAILSSEVVINKHLNHFIYYKPKDIIAGDFYYFEDYNNHLFIAACDCTGHGVPGAMVSVVCSNALTKAIKEFKLTDPALIFDKTRELVIENFKGSSQEIKDGMDASMIVFNKKTKQIMWCGANNPLWYIEDGELKEITPNKQPIAFYDYAKPYTSVEIITKPKTSYYLITDGYADQFGGPKGKKFKYKELKTLILTNVNEVMSKQKNALSSSFDVWKGDLEQVDDVTIFGFNFNTNTLHEKIS